jgi:hypothetical protein
MKILEKIDTISDSVIGHFSIKTIKKDGSVDLYEEKNLIMDNARAIMSKMVGGFEFRSIKALKLGTAGHFNGNYLQPKTAVDGNFVPARTMLFSEENPSVETTYELNFQPSEGLLVQSLTALNSSDIDEGCTIEQTIAGNVLTFVAYIPEAAANKLVNTSVDGVVPYTEAALYTNNAAGTDEKIFSAKTFPVKVKEDTVAFEITWSITF